MLRYRFSELLVTVTDELDLLLQSSCTSKSTLALAAATGEWVGGVGVTMKKSFLGSSA
jgi:hypothetical protein